MLRDSSSTDESQDCSTTTDSTPTRRMTLGLIGAGMLSTPAAADSHCDDGSSWFDFFWFDDDCDDADTGDPTVVPASHPRSSVDDARYVFVVNRND